MYRRIINGLRPVYYEPFPMRTIEDWYAELGLNIQSGIDEISLHKDNPTNLYIPDGAD